MQAQIVQIQIQPILSEDYKELGFTTLKETKQQLEQWNYYDFLPSKEKSEKSAGKEY